MRTPSLILQLQNNCCLLQHIMDSNFSFEKTLQDQQGNIGKMPILGDANGLEHVWYVVSSLLEDLRGAPYCHFLHS